MGGRSDKALLPWRSFYKCLRPLLFSRPYRVDGPLQIHGTMAVDSQDYGGMPFSMGWGADNRSSGATDGQFYDFRDDALPNGIHIVGPAKRQEQEQEQELEQELEQEDPTSASHLLQEVEGCRALYVPPDTYLRVVLGLGSHKFVFGHNFVSKTNDYTLTMSIMFDFTEHKV